jgi:hypothetical protein
MNVASARRVAAVLLGAFVFGLAMAWLKGSNGGLRDAVGNASAPWLLLPFLAGALLSGGPTRGRSLLGGACAGLLASLIALAGFYLAESFVLDLGPHPWLTDLSLTLGAARFWVQRAFVSGPVFGALGVWWHKRRSLTAAGLVAAVFVLEPAAWWLYGDVVLGSASSAAYPVLTYPELSLAEIAVGAGGFVLLARYTRRREPAPGSAI